MPKCNNYGKTFPEEKVVYDGEEDMDFCPECGEGNCIDFEAPHTLTIEEIRQTIPHYLDFALHKDLIAFCVCDRIYFRNCDIHDFDTITLEELSEWSCKSEDELLKFADRGNLFGWHISNLVIYDKPRELSEFYAKCSKYDLDKKQVYEAHCTDCGNKHGIAPCKYINQRWCIPLKRPPQSWCYVEKKGA